MNGNDERYLKEKGPKRWQLPNILLMLVIIFTTLFCIFLVFTCKSPDIRFDSEKVSLLAGPWKITYQGKIVTAYLPFLEQIPAGEKVTYEITLPEQSKIKEQSYNSIMISAVHEYVKVWLDDELLYEFGYDHSMPFSDEPGNGRLIVRLTDGFEGKLLRIEKIGYYDNYAAIMRKAFIGTKNALVFSIYHESIPIIFINLCIIILSIGLLVASFLFKRKKVVSQLRYLSIFSAYTSMWMILESGGFQFLAGNPVLISYSTFTVFIVIPFFFIRFLVTYESFQDSFYMKTLQYVSFAAIVVIHALQIFSINNYFKSVFVTHFIILLIVIGVLGKFILVRLRKETMKERHLFVSCFALGLFTMIDVIRFYITPSYRTTFFTQIGILFYFIILSYFAIQKIVIDYENSLSKMLYEQMAYVDILTGLPNRNAFERKMDYYRENEAANPMILILDLNELKKINDTLGHAKGDNAIICLGKALKKSFDNEINIFRIGGDEFCAILEHSTEENIMEKMELLKDHLHQMVEQNELPITVAAGWCQKEGLMSVDETFNKADTKMYENKFIMKQIPEY